MFVSARCSIYFYHHVCVTKAGKDTSAVVLVAIVTAAVWATGCFLLSKQSWEN